MKTYMLKCPQCGGNLEIQEDREMFYCTYCGAKISLNTISKSELRVKEIEHEEQMERIAQAKDKQLYILLAIIAVVVLLLTGGMLVLVAIK